MSGDQKHQSADPLTSGSGTDSELDLGQIGSLLIALGAYHTEADACYNAEAYFGKLHHARSSNRGLSCFADLDVHRTSFSNAYRKEAEKQKSPQMGSWRAHRRCEGAELAPVSNFATPTS